MAGLASNFLYKKKMISGQTAKKYIPNEVGVYIKLQTTGFGAVLIDLFFSIIKTVQLAGFCPFKHSHSESANTNQIDTNLTVMLLQDNY